MSMDKQLTLLERPDTNDEPQVEPAEMGGHAQTENLKMVTDLRLLNGRYIVVEYLMTGMSQYSNRNNRRLAHCIPLTL